MLNIPETNKNTSRGVVKEEDPIDSIRQHHHHHDKAEAAEKSAGAGNFENKM